MVEIRVFVMAGNYHQFRSWQHEDMEERRHARFIFTGQQLRGIRGRLIKTGTWWEVDQEIQDMANFLVARGELIWNAEEGA